MSEIPPEIKAEASSNARRFGRWAAGFSLVTPFAVILSYIVLFAFMQSHGQTRFTVFAVIGMLPLFLIVSGIALGIISLVMNKRKESKSIFGIAVAGVAINSLFLVLLVVAPIVMRFTFLKDYPKTPQDKLAKAMQKMMSASTGEDRFYALNDAAKESFVAGKIEEASKFAIELLTLAPDYTGNWNYGNAIQDGNLVLGRIAVREGRIGEAKQYLLAAGNSRGSPQMNSFGPNMSLAKDLLEKGEKDVVLQYFELCRKFWEMDSGKLDDWSREVKTDGIPDFGANLVY